MHSSYVSHIPVTRFDGGKTDSIYTSFSSLLVYVLLKNSLIGFNGLAQNLQLYRFSLSNTVLELERPDRNLPQGSIKHPSI